MTFISVVLIFLACIAICYFILNYYRRQSCIKTANSLPGPKSFPLIGNAFYLLQRNPDEFLDILIKLREKYFTPFRFWMGNKLFIVIDKPDQIQTILQNSSCLDKSILYYFLESLLGKGLITAPDGIILPKDSDIIIPFITLHRNEKYWPNPLVFDPDRFLSERIGTSYKYYMPFSMGPRNCIGMKYAMISMKVLLATLIRSFRFKVDKIIQIDKIKLNMDITLSTVEPIKVKIEKRDLY